MDFKGWDHQFSKGTHDGNHTLAFGNINANRVHSHFSYAVFVIRDHPSLIVDSSYSVTRAMNPTCLIERYNEGWVTVLRADMGSPSVKAPPDYSLIVA